MTAATNHSPTPGGAGAHGVSPASDTPVLSVRDLHVHFGTEAGRVHAVRGVDLDLYPGRTLAVVGESGSGKSVTSLAIMGLLPEHARVEGSVTYNGKELIGLSDKAMSVHRGPDIAMVFQDPLSSLTPVFTVGDQIIEALRAHGTISKEAGRKRAIELLDLVGIPSPKTRVDSYPHEFSGGMRQRVVIAIAMANNPRVIIADEPTTALDVTIQAQILDVLKVAQRETGAAVLMITHDLGVVAGVADDVLVMYAGRPVEKAEVDELYGRPSMPYTLGLLGSIPRVDRTADEPLVPIEGSPPNLLHEPEGCAFMARCPMAIAACATAEPPLERVAGSVAGRVPHSAACIRSHELRAGIDARDVFPVPPATSSELATVPRQERKNVLRITDLHKEFPLMKGALLKRRVGTVKAVDGISLDLAEGECLALVGESGCGKTTTLLEIMEMNPKMTGDVVVLGSSIGSLKRASEAKDLRRHIQLVFQDPMGALDPRFTVYEVLSEPLRTAGMSAADTKKRVRELMQLVGLMPDHVNRFPAQFSGGQRQRIGIARALALNPSVIVLDEPVSALDVSIQAGVINLLDKLKAELGLSYLFVAHDLAVVRHISDRVAVMYLGKIVEIGDVDEVFDHPTHPYTRALLSAIPVPDPELERHRERIVLKGDLPSPLDRPVGCDFASRCPVFLGLDEERRARCRAEVPPLVPVSELSSRIGGAHAADGVRAGHGRHDHEQACFYPNEPLISRSILPDAPEVISPAAAADPFARPDAPAPGVPSERNPR